MNMDILVKQLKTGSQEAWKMIVDNYSKKVYNIALNFVGNRDEAADITQDIFLKLYNNIEKFNHEEGNLTSWLLTLSRNYCIDYWRKNKYHRKNLELDDTLAVEAPASIKTPEDKAVNENESAYLRKKLMLLPPDLRTLIIMRDIEDYTYEEISEHLDIPLGTTKSRINRARTRLARILLEEKGR